MQVLGTAILARALPPSEFGTFALASIVTGFAAVFSDFGLAAATIQRRELTQATVSSVFYLNAVLGFAVMFLCCLAAPWAAKYYGSPQITWAVVGIALTIPLNALSAQHVALLSRQMKFTEVQTINTVSQTFGLLCGIGTAITVTAGYQALVANVFGAAASYLLLAWYLCSWRPSGGIDRLSIRSATAFGSYLVGFQVMNFVGRQADVSMIGGRWGPAAVGHYSRAYQLMLMPINIVNGPLASAVVPALSRLQAHPVRWLRAFRGVVILTTILGCAMASQLAVLSDQVILLVYGEQWKQAIPIFSALSWSMFFTFPMGTMAWAAISTGHSKSMFRWGVATMCVLPLAFWLSVPHGAVVVAQTYTITVGLLLPVCMYINLRDTPARVIALVRDMAPIWCAGGIAALAGSYWGGSDVLSLKHAVLKSVTALTIYGGMCSLLIAYSKDMRELVVTVASDGVSAARRLLGKE